ncbi:MAG: hypothetical protein AAF244_02395 [Pseudomonadota bacterium]
MNQAPQLTKKQKQNLKEFILAKENRLGVIVLCVGALALIWVLFSAYNKFTGTVDTTEYYTQQPAEAPKPEYVQEQKPEKPKYKVQSDIEEANIIGAWDGQAENGRVLLQLSNGIYKFAFVSRTNAKPNIYSMGTYRLNNGILHLQPGSDYKAAQKEFPGYHNLTRSPFPISVVRRGNRLILQRPDQSSGVYVPPVHHMLKLMPDELAVLEPLK